MRPAVQLLLPGLFDLPADEVDPDFASRRLPGLNRLLRYAAPRASRRFTLDGMLRDSLGLPGPPEASLPVAPAVLEGDDGGGGVLIAEAVHLRPDLNSALVLPIARNTRNSEDIDILINDLNELFKADCIFSATSGGSYLMRLSTLAAPDFYPHPLSAVGKPVNPYIEQSRSALPWYRLQNEIQMFLHQHDRNSARLRDGLLPVNSLWFWGGGERPQIVREGRWYCDDELLNRFARQLGLTVASTASFAAAAPADEPVTVLDLRLLRVLKGQQDAALEDLLLALEKEVVEPALSRRGADVVLRSGSSLDYVYGPRSQLRFWRREVTLADCLARE